MTIADSRYNQAVGIIGTTVITDDSIVMTPSTGDTVTIAAATNGVLNITTVDTAAAAGNIQITADGTVDIDSAGVLTLDSGAAINIEPASGSAILLDGTISVDAGVVTGATAITSATIDATTDFTVGDTVITNGVITDSTGLSLAANVNTTGTISANNQALLSNNTLVFQNAAGIGSITSKRNAANPGIGFQVITQNASDGDEPRLAITSGVNTAVMTLSALTLDLDGDLEFQGAQSITTTSGDLTLAPASDLYINPTAAGGTFSFGTGVSSNYMFQIGGAWTSGPASTICSGITYNAQLTTDALNHSVSATHMHMGADLGAKINLLRNIGTVATMYLTEPNIELDPLVTGSDFSVTQAATLYINNAPTEAGTGGNRSYALFVDSCASRFDGAISLGTDHGDDGQQLTSGGDGAACDWTAASSIREDKDIIGLADPDEALQTMLSSKAYNFHYKNKRGTGDTLTNYVGIMADEAPWAMHYKGKIVNPVNTLGYTVLAFQAMERQVEELQARLAAIGG
jgi:hypothetical protein